MSTSRPFEAAFRSVVEEVDIAQARSAQHVRLLVIDERTPEISRKNGELVAHVRREKARDIDVMTPVRWRRLIDEMLAVSGLRAHEATTAAQALVKPTGSFGAGPNAAALLAAYMVAASLHRRDSDQITCIDPQCGCGPLDLEMSLLDRTPGDATDGGAFCVGSS